VNQHYILTTYRSMLVASEVELRDLETVYSLRINRKHVGDVSIFPNYALSFGIIGIKCSRAQILIWGGTRFWLVDLHTSELRAGQSTYDEIHGAFPLNGSWILVGETTLMTLDASTATLSRSTLTRLSSSRHGGRDQCFASTIGKTEFRHLSPSLTRGTVHWAS
jgi:hypothetical protein